MSSNDSNNNSQQQQPTVPIEIEGGYIRRGGVKFISGTPLTEDIMAQVPLDAYSLNYDKVCLTFGKPLHDIPPFVLRVFEFLTVKGVNTEGIFRKPGASAEIQSLKKRMNAGEKVDLNDVSIHALASLLKTFFRELPEPLLTFECYDLFIECSRIPTTAQSAAVQQHIPNPRLDCVKKLVYYLPNNNRHLLKNLCDFLACIARHEKTNLMNADSLATIFGPSILRHPKDRKMGEKELLEEVKAGQIVVEMLISEFVYIFNTETYKYKEIHSDIAGQTVAEIRQSIRRFTFKMSAKNVLNIKELEQLKSLKEEWDEEEPKKLPSPKANVAQQQMQQSSSPRSASPSSPSSSPRNNNGSTKTAVKKIVIASQKAQVSYETQPSNIKFDAKGNVLQRKINSPRTNSPRNATANNDKLEQVQQSNLNQQENDLLLAAPANEFASYQESVALDDDKQSAQIVSPRIKTNNNNNAAQPAANERSFSRRRGILPNSGPPVLCEDINDDPEFLTPQEEWMRMNND